MSVLVASKYGGYTLNSKRTVEIMQKIKTMLAIVLAILLTLSILGAVSANAASFMSASTDASGNTVYTIGSDSFKADECKNKVFGGFALKLTYLSYGGLFDVLANSNVFTIDNGDIAELVAGAKGGGGSGLWGLFGSLYQSMTVAGVGLALMWTLLSLIEKMSEGKMTEELVLSLFAKLLIAAFIISYGVELCSTLLYLGNAVFEAFRGQVDVWFAAQAENTTDMCTEALIKLNEIKEGNVFTCCGYIIEGLVPAIAMLFCWLLACTQLISRILELGIRTAFMPIGVADIMTHGTRSPGMRYLKSYAGCACQGAALYIILLSGVSLMNSGSLFQMFGGDDTQLQGLAGTTGRVVISIVIAITMLGMMKKVDNLLREVFAS